MQMVGRRTALYLTVAILWAVGAVIVALTKRDLNVSKDFYQATASLLPLLLLAQLVRLASVRDWVFIRHRRAFEEPIKELQEFERRISEIRAEKRGTDDAFLQLSIERVEESVSQQKEELFNDSVVARRWGRLLLELITGNLIMSLILGSAGIIATLVALGEGSTNVTFFLSATAVAWLLIALLIFEALMFFESPSSS
jgi:hypothetical protein